MSRLMSCLVALCFAPIPVFAQQITGGVESGVVQSGVPPARDTRPTTGRSIIRGRVVTSDGGQPIRRADIRVTAQEVRGGRLTLTDADGRYEVRDLPAGRFTISASKAAFVTWAYGQTRPNVPGKAVALLDGQTAENIDVHLARGAVIAGRVIDEFGEPVPNASVTPMRQQYAQGQRRLLNIGNRTQTNDIGEYRIFGLSPGQYYVSAAAQALTFAVPNGNTPELSGQRSGYAPTFYPATADSTLAQKLTVGLAQTLSGIDIALTPVRLATITGTAFDAQGRPMTGTGVFATLRGVTGAGGPGGPVRPDGSFTLPNVPPGEYVLRANAPRSAPAPGATVIGPPDFSVAVVTVSGDDVTGVRLTPIIPVTVSGHVSFDDAGAAQSVNSSSIRMAVQALNQDDLTLGVGVLGTPPSPLKEGFVFEVKTAPGRIGLRPFMASAPGTSSGWQVKSVRVNGIDVVDTGLDVGSQGVAGIEIEMTNHVQQLSGTVTDGNGAGVKDYVVALFSQDHARWKVPMNRYFALARPGDDGGFKVATLPTGEYYAIALDRIAPEDWQDPDTLESLSRLATTFALTPGDTRTLNLRLSALP
jgi:hypothetical protein